MTAGSGVQHSEFNHSAEHKLHLLQIWIFPEQRNLQPGYEQKMFSRDDKLNRLRLITSSDGRDQSVSVHQNVDLYAGVLESGINIRHDIAPAHKVFLQVVRGTLTANGQSIAAGDGMQVTNEEMLSICATSEAEILLFDMG